MASPKESGAAEWASQPGAFVLVAIIGGVALAVIAASLDSSTTTAEARSSRASSYVLGEVDNGVFSEIGIPRPRQFFSAAGSEAYVGLRWKRWGQRSTVATGRYSNGRGKSRAVTLTAFSRGADRSCESKRAYARLRIAVAGQSPLIVSICQ